MMGSMPENRLDIRVPDVHVLRLVARSILALIFISFAALSISPMSVFSTATAMATATKNGVLSRREEGSAFLTTLFCDLSRSGLIGDGDQALFLGRYSGSAIKSIIKNNKMELVASCSGKIPRCRFRSVVHVGTLDFVFSSNGISDIEFIDRMLKIGGIGVIRLSSKRFVPYRVISNFRIVYIRKFHFTVIAMRKQFDGSRQRMTSVLQPRRLLALPEMNEEETLDMVEDALLDSVRSSLSGRKSQGSSLRNLKFLPDLSGDSLSGYPKQIFIEVISKLSSIHHDSDVSAVKWFLNYYPTKKLPFQIVRLQLKEGGAGKEDEEEAEISIRLRNGPRTDEFVGMKANAAIVEAMVRSGATILVD